MATRGARNLIFLSRSGAISQEAQSLIEHLKKKSCQAQIFICDIANKAELSAAIEECEKSMPPIKGCIQGSMVLEASPLQQVPSIHKANRI
jgi:KR domain